jgi:hypothetical protein
MACPNIRISTYSLLLEDDLPPDTPFVFALIISTILDGLLNQLLGLKPFLGYLR